MFHRGMALGGLASLCLINALVCAAVPAAAEGLSVIDRPRPEYDAKGLPLGAFRLFPTLEAGINADDNVYSTDTHTAKDIFYTVAPAIDLKSQWSNHFLEFTVGSRSYYYWSHTDENLTDWNVGAKGRLDIVRGSAIFLTQTYNKEHESRTSPNSPGFIETPVRYTDIHTQTHMTVQPNRFGIAAGGSRDRYDYENTPIIGGGILNNQDRDRTEYEAYGKAFYEFRGGYSAFVRGTYDSRSFDLKHDRSGLDRSSHGYRIDAGVNLYLTRLLEGEIYAGYLDRRFKAPLADISGLGYGLRLKWYVSPLATLHIRAARTLDETTLQSASISSNREVDGGIDYEIMRNVILQASGSYMDSSFVGSGRDDKMTTAHLGLKYLINAYMNGTVGYDQQQRRSNAAGQDFSDNLLNLMVNLQL